MPSPPAARPRLSPTALRTVRVVVGMGVVLVVGGAVSVALGGAFASVPVGLVAAVAGLRLWKAPVRGPGGSVEPPASGSSSPDPSER